jgi:hypothetical protein
MQRPCACRENLCESSWAGPSRPSRASGRFRRPGPPHAADRAETKGWFPIREIGEIRGQKFFLKKVLAALKAQFDGHPSTGANLCQWENGGHPAWKAADRMTGILKSVLDGCDGPINSNSTQTNRNSARPGCG